MTSTNKSLTGIILSGDINTNEGQLGQTVFKSLTGNSVMTPSADFESIYNKYIIEANGNYTLTLPGIQPTAGSFTANLVQLGWECIIVNNDDTNTLDVLEESTGARKVLLQPGESARLIAEQDNGVSEDDWVVILNSNGNCFTVQNAAENLTADDIVDITNDGVIKANGIKLNNLINSFGNVAGTESTSQFTIDEENNVYYVQSLDATTTIGTDIRGNTVIVSPGTNANFVIFVKTTLSGEIIWYRQVNYTNPASGSIIPRHSLSYDPVNKHIWFGNRIFVTGGTGDIGTMSVQLQNHPYTGVGAATKPLVGNELGAYIIAFDIYGNNYEFESIYSDTALTGAVSIGKIIVDKNGVAHVCGLVNPNSGSGTATIIFPNSGTDIQIDDTHLDPPNSLRTPMVARYVPGVGFERVLIGRDGAGAPDQVFSNQIALDKSNDNLFVMSNTRSTATWSWGRIYTSGANADTSPLITVLAANNPNQNIIKVDSTTYTPALLAIIDGTDIGDNSYQMIYDNIRDHLVIINISNTSAVTFHDGYSTTIGASVGSSTGTYIARLDSSLIWYNIIDTDILDIHCLDTEGNVIMFGYTGSSITLGGTTYGSGGLIYGKIDIDNNFIFTRRLSGNDIGSNFICPVESINNQNTYYLHSGFITSNITENGISLTTGGGTSTQIFTYFVDSANSPLGIVVDNVTSGNPANICISGKYTMKNNTLVKGNDYFNDFGDITTNPIVKPKIGKAISTTDIILNLNK